MTSQDEDGKRERKHLSRAVITLNGFMNVAETTYGCCSCSTTGVAAQTGSVTHPLSHSYQAAKSSVHIQIDHSRGRASWERGRWPVKNTHTHITSTTTRRKCKTRFAGEDHASREGDPTITQLSHFTESYALSRGGAGAPWKGAQGSVPFPCFFTHS